MSDYRSLLSAVLAFALLGSTGSAAAAGPGGPLFATEQAVASDVADTGRWTGDWADLYLCHDSSSTDDRSDDNDTYENSQGECGRNCWSYEDSGDRWDRGEECCRTSAGSGPTGDVCYEGAGENTTAVEFRGCTVVRSEGWEGYPRVSMEQNDESRCGGFVDWRAWWKAVRDCVRTGHCSPTALPVAPHEGPPRPGP